MLDLSALLPHRYLATGSTDACIALWAVEDMVCVRTFASMDNEINNLSFTPDGRYLTYFDKLAGLCTLEVESGADVLGCTVLCNAVLTDGPGKGCLREHTM